MSVLFPELEHSSTFQVQTTERAEQDNVQSKTVCISHLQYVVVMDSTGEYCMYCLHT